MKAIILAAGKGTASLDERKHIPKCLLPSSESATVLDVILEACQANGIKEFAVVGGFAMLKIMEAYPGLKYYYNRSWESTGSLASMAQASKEFNDDLLISFSDIVYDSGAVEKLLRSDADLAIDKSAFTSWPKPESSITNSKRPIIPFRGVRIS